MTRAEMEGFSGKKALRVTDSLGPRGHGALSWSLRGTM